MDEVYLYLYNNILTEDDRDLFLDKSFAEAEKYAKENFSSETEIIGFLRKYENAVTEKATDPESLQSQGEMLKIFYPHEDFLENRITLLATKKLNIDLESALLSEMYEILSLSKEVNPVSPEFKDEIKDFREMRDNLAEFTKNISTAKNTSNLLGEINYIINSDLQHNIDIKRLDEKVFDATIMTSLAPIGRDGINGFVIMLNKDQRTDEIADDLDVKNSLMKVFNNLDLDTKEKIVNDIISEINHLDYRNSSEQFANYVGNIIIKESLDLIPEGQKNNLNFDQINNAIDKSSARNR